MSDSHLPPAWVAVARASALKRKPLSVYYQGEPVVIFRDGAGIAALEDRCPHRGVPLSQGHVDGSHIRCVYHGWQFNRRGELSLMPGDPDFRPCSRQLLKTYLGCEKEGLIWLVAGEAPTGSPFVPEIHSTHAYRTASVSIAAPLVDVIENLLDPLHTHSIHAGIIRSDKKARHRCDVTVTHVRDGYQATYVEQHRQSGVLSRVFGGGIIKSVGRIRYPGIVEIEYHSARGIELAVVIYLHVREDEACQLIVRSYFRRGVVPVCLKAWVLFPFQWVTFAQDRRILELQHKTNRRAHTEPPAYIVTHCDIMRRYIERALAGDIAHTDEHKVLML